MRTKTKQYDVFFVDDDAGIRKIISAELEGINCKVRCFANGSDCLEQLGRQNCNLLITDVKMPFNRTRRPVKHMGHLFIGSSFENQL